MKIKTVIQCMLLASIIPASSIMVANDDVPDEEKVIDTKRMILTK